MGGCNPAWSDWGPTSAGLQHQPGEDLCLIWRGCKSAAWDAQQLPGLVVGHVWRHRCLPRSHNCSPDAQPGLPLGAACHLSPQLRCTYDAGAHGVQLGQLPAGGALLMYASLVELLPNPCPHNTAGAHGLRLGLLPAGGALRSWSLPAAAHRAVRRLRSVCFRGAERARRRGLPGRICWCLLGSLDVGWVQRTVR